MIVRNYTSVTLFLVAQTTKRSFLITRLKWHSQTAKCWKYLQSNSLSSLINWLSRWIICLMYDYNLAFWMRAINLNNGCGWTIILYVWHAFWAVCRALASVAPACWLKRKRKDKSAGFPLVWYDKLPTDAWDMCKYYCCSTTEIMSLFIVNGLHLQVPDFKKLCQINEQIFQPK